jgi:TRAP-type C4-dicarboxylate transport system substrate-binding protein
MDTSTSTQNSWIWGIAAVVAISAIFIMARTTPVLQAQEPRELTWVITHKPITVFDRAKEVFADEFNKDSDIKISLKILGPDNFDTAAHRLGTKDVFDMMERGEAQIGTISLSSLTKDIPETALFSLPYLFKDDAAVEAVFGGDIGKGILDSMTAFLPARALAFTFSGGWLVLQSNTTTFQKPSDFVGKHLTTINGGIAQDVLASTGADVVPLDIVNTSNREVNESLNNYDGIETVFTRLHKMDSPKIVTDTKHALFVTSILVDKTFYASLSPRDQRAVERAAAAASAVERTDSRQLAETNKQDLISRGTRVVELTAEERSALASKMKGVYAAYEKSVGKDIIEKVRAMQQ